MRPRSVVLVVCSALALTASTALGVASAASPGNATKGKALYLRPGVFCYTCHILKAAGSTGRDGPNLDQTKPSFARIVAAVTKGSNPSKKWPTGMPGYARAGELTKAEIQDLAAFVYASTHK